MREPLKIMLDKLGVGYILSAYETCPWSAYDEENGVTCSAEVRMNNDGDEFEAEIQMMHDNPTDDKPALEQVFWLLGRPAVAGKWDVKGIKFHNQDGDDGTHNFMEKAVNFFHACVQELKMGKVPDIDDIWGREMKNKDRFGQGSQGGGSKAPKIKPQALLGMKNGRGF